ncbi:hypothetical protein MKX03_015022 [Papaver bracteatum]|nr:hypothetical protein MKX03_015022 [Papaver bracteatum]
MGTSVSETNSSSLHLENNNSNVAEEGGTTLSKKTAKKEAMKQEKLKRQQEAAAAAAALASASIESDPLSENYGEVALQEMQSKAITGRKWIRIGLVKSLKDKTNIGFLVLMSLISLPHSLSFLLPLFLFLLQNKKDFTIQCVLTVAENLTSRQMVKFATSLSKESHVDVEGLYQNKALPMLPINIDDKKAMHSGEKFVHVNQDTRLNFRVLDFRTPANQGIFYFVGIHTPKLIAGSSEGGASVFRLDYKGRPACLAQSPQLHKQLSICSDFMCVFEVGPVFRAEDSFTHRHLCELTGLDVMDIVDGLFVAIFDSLNENCKKELEAIGEQYPFKPLSLLRQPHYFSKPSSTSVQPTTSASTISPTSSLLSRVTSPFSRVPTSSLPTTTPLSPTSPSIPTAPTPAITRVPTSSVPTSTVSTPPLSLTAPSVTTVPTHTSDPTPTTAPPTVPSRPVTRASRGIHKPIHRLNPSTPSFNIRKTLLFPRDPHRISP